MKRWFCFFHMFYWGTLAEAQTAVPCRPSSWAGLAETVLKHAPDRPILEARVRGAKQRLEEARLAPPASFSAELSSSRDPGASVQASASYLWTLERGGKSQARMDVARWESERIALEARDRDLQLLVEVGLIGERLQQIEHEQDVLAEAIGTYQAILKQYAGRPLLSPEQDANSAVFRLAKDEAALKAAHMGLERAQLLGRLRFLSGCETLEVPESKSRLERSWPDVPGTFPEAESVLARDVQATQSLAEAQWKNEESRTFADVTIGPLLGWDVGAEGQELQAGVSLSLPLLQSRRESSIAIATAVRAEKVAEADAVLRQLRAERETWLQVYRQARSHLQGGITEDEARHKHERLEGIFITGRVSAPLIIESHRQLQDHLAARHALALKALEALLNLRRLDGQLKKEDL